MKKTIITRLICIVMTIIMSGALIGCAAGATGSNSGPGEAPYFTKGVYVNYAAEAKDPEKTYFYVFYDEAAGCTDDGTVGIGLPFSCKQSSGSVDFSFGGEDEDLMTLTVESAQNGTVIGHFDDGIKLVFEPVPDADPDNFDAENYLKASVGEELIYRDANGWEVEYDPNLFDINGGGPTVSFVYKGESAGTNMITASYDVGKDAKTAIEDLAKEWGDKTEISEGIFPGTEDVTGYRATLPPEEGTSGLYMTAIARDYMDGYLVFELTGHNSGDDETDIPVSDALAGIIDSLTFVSYEQ